MIAMLTGTLARVGENDAVISVGGVGYQFQATSRCLARLGGAGAEVTVLIDTAIKDDRIVLTGFADAAVKESFLLLQTVQGVGVKAALSILSALSPDDLMLALSAGDKAMIGPKLAQRVINELADKVSGLSLGPSAGLASTETPCNPALADAVSALVNLGYGRAEAHAAVVLVMQGLDAPAVESILPLALRELGR